MTLSDFSIRRPVFAWMAMIALMFFGVLSYQKLGVAMLPEISFPEVTIHVSWPSAAPEVMETQIVDPIEQSVIAVEGVTDIEANMRQGFANIKLTFDPNKDLDAALQETNAKLRSVSLPSDVSPPTIDKINTDDNPILWVAVTTNKRSFHDLIDYVDLHLRSRFEVLPGVGSLVLGGWEDRSLRVWVDNDKLTKNQLTILDVKNTLKLENQDVAAGYLEGDQQQKNLRVLGQPFDPASFGQIPVSTRGGQRIYNSTIKLSDVAQVEDGLDDVRSQARSNGAISLGVGVQKLHGANDVEIGKAVVALVAQLNKELAATGDSDIHLIVNYDGTHNTARAIQETEFTLIESVIITGIVCWIFLGSWSSTFNVLLSIPTSVLGTFIVLNALGFTLNLFTLLGISLAIGIVVDDAIMVLENIVRHFHTGLSARSASLLGAREITFAATAATFAVAVIFAPIIFVGGIVGKLMFQFGTTISVAVILSLLEAITLTPMRCSQFMTRRQDESWLSVRVNILLSQWARRYRSLLELCLRWRWVTIGISVLLFGISCGIAPFLNKEAFPKQDVGVLLVKFQTPVGSSLTFTATKAAKLEALYKTEPTIDHYFINCGGFAGGETNQGISFVSLKDRSLRKETQSQISDRLRDTLAKDPEMSKPNCLMTFIDVSGSVGGAKRGTGIELSVRGPDFEVLKAKVEALTERYAKSGFMTDIDTDFRDGVTEVHVLPDRERASAAGVTVQQIADTVNAAIGGIRIGKFTFGTRRDDVRMRLIPEQWQNLNDISRLYLRSESGDLIPLNTVAFIKPEKKLLSITREMRERAINIYANVASDKSTTTALDFAKTEAGKILPSGYHIVEVGASKDLTDNIKAVGLLFALAILVIYMTLAVQFNSFLNPLAIMVAVPFTFTGALLGLAVTHSTINLYSGIGMIVLMGIAAKNSILLVEFFNQQQYIHGKSLLNSILDGAPIRLRPILMTSTATVASMLPLVFGIGPGSEVRTSLGIVVISGVIVSTLFSLLVVPCVYSLLAPLEGNTRKAEQELDAAGRSI